MSWSSVLGRIRPQVLWSSLARPGGVAAAAGRLPSAQGSGGAMGGALAGSSSPSRSWNGVVGEGQGLQIRGMATSNLKHKKILKMAKG